jgi:hypothetical protein
MPLKPGSSQKVISQNIRELYHANESKPASEQRPPAQINAMSNARKTGRGGKGK